MAQLRDTQTSTLVDTGDPLDVVVLADAVGLAEVLFDDVGLAFDPDAVRTAANDELAGIDAELANAGPDERAALTERRDALTARLTADPARVQAVQSRITEARARSDRASI